MLLDEGQFVHAGAIRGAVEVNGEGARAGDGVAVEDEATLTVTSRADDSEILVFDLP